MIVSDKRRNSSSYNITSKLENICKTIINGVKEVDELKVTRTNIKKGLKGCLNLFWEICTKRYPSLRSPRPGKSRKGGPRKVTPSKGGGDRTDERETGHVDHRTLRKRKGRCNPEAKGPDIQRRKNQIKKRPTLFGKSSHSFPFTFHVKTRKYGFLRKYVKSLK